MSDQPLPARPESPAPAITDVHCIPRLPKYPLNQLVTYEISQYRAALEAALEHIADGSADHLLITRRLEEVIAEQDSRAGVFKVPRTWPPAL